MQTSKLTAHTVYAVKERSWGDCQPVLLIEAVLWKWSDEWGHWDGAEKRHTARVHSKAKKGDRAGRSDSWRATNWEIGLPTLKLNNVSARRFLQKSDDDSILTKPFPIFEEALQKMNLLVLFAEGHDGRMVGDIKSSVEVEVELVNGSFESVRVDLDWIRPQQYTSDWNTYVEEKRKGDVARVDLEMRTAKRKEESDKTAFEIVSRVDLLAGPPATYTYSGERHDLRRKSTTGGISSTYEVSQALLLKLLSLAERESAS